MRLAREFLTLALVAVVTGCGPTIKKNVRLQWEPWDEKEYKQEKSGVIVELTEKEVPVVKTELVKCDQNGDAVHHVVTDSKGNSFKGDPVVEQVNLAAFAVGVWRQFTITNNVSKVIRMNMVTVRLKDPNGTLYEPTYVETMKDQLGGLWGCNNVGKINNAVNKLNGKIHMLSRNSEVTPGETKDFWVFFPVSTLEDKEMLDANRGTWIFRVFGVPVEMNDAGAPTKVENFELRTKLRIFMETFKDGKLEKSRELGVEDSGEGDEGEPKKKKKKKADEDATESKPQAAAEPVPAPAAEQPAAQPAAAPAAAPAAEPAPAQTAAAPAAQPAAAPAEKAAEPEAAAADEGKKKKKKKK
ncbi:MAG: hypothetical protein HY904_05755 [Deltaproteobacteria bacterium]|nr:hypothetical protein [Deltaproteobacteria bacterium]